MDEEGRAWVEVDDTELFDFVEDLLIEDHDLDYLWVGTREEPGCPTCYTMTFEGDLLSKIQAALATIDATQAHEIYVLNNPEQPK